MERIVYVASHPDEPEVLDRLLPALIDAGFTPHHYHTTKVGGAPLEDAMRFLQLGVPMVVCATYRSIATRWIGLLATAANSLPQSRVFVVQMNEDLDMDRLSLTRVVADYWRDPGGALHSLCEALADTYPPDAPPSEIAPRRAPLSDYLDDVTTVTQFDASTVEAFRIQLRPSAGARLATGLSAWEFLEQSSLMRDGRLTRAGVLLFGREPSTTIPTATVQCTQYFGEDRTARREIVAIAGNVPSQIAAAHRFVAERVREGDAPTAGEVNAQPVHRYPMIAVREVIANALVHRDYQATDMCVHVRLFTDRLEVTSPGGWQGRIVEESREYDIRTLVGESRRRNFRLASVLTWSPLFEGEGSGLPSAVEECDRLGAPHPVMIPSDDFVTLVLRPRQGVDATHIRDFLVDYRRRVASVHGMMAVPGYSDLRRVPLDEGYVSPQIVPDGEPPLRDLWHFDELITHAVLVGDPGSGKTTTCGALMLAHAANPALPIPFFVRLRDFAVGAHIDRSVVGHIEDQFGALYQLAPLPGLIERLLMSDGGALVIFDGLDELLDVTTRADVAAIIELFGTEFPQARVLVTSRSAAGQIPLDKRQFSSFRLVPFDAEQVDQYVRKWFSRFGEADRGLEESFMRESSDVPDLRSNPMMLSLMCELYRGERSFPRQRADIYERCALFLFERWDRQRGIASAVVETRHMENVLRRLAWRIFSQDIEQARERDLVAEAAAYFLEARSDSEVEARDAALEFVDACRGRAWILTDVGVDPRGERLYAFSHRTFLEYFAAADLVRRTAVENLAKVLEQRVTDPRWAAVCQLIVQLSDRSSEKGASRLLSVLLDYAADLDAQERAGVLDFVAECASFVHLPASLLREVSRISNHDSE